MSAKLTALIPCKNERRNIRACIESVQPFADEILVADSGSSDETIDIVRDTGNCRIIEREFISYADFKNWAIPQAQHDWILLVDADERVTPELGAEIRQLLQNPPPETDGYWIDRSNHYLGYHIRHCGWNSDAVIRLFRRECRYETRLVHEEIDLPSSRLDALKNPMLHYTTWDSEQYLIKMSRYAAWGALDMQKAGRQPSILAMLTRAPLRFFQLYFLRLGFLDGVPGFHICMHTAYYSFLKQAKLWEITHSLPQPDAESDLTARSEERSILAFPRDETLTTGRGISQKRLKAA